MPTVRGLPGDSNTVTTISLRWIVISLTTQRRCPSLFAAAENYDLVIGSRYVAGGTIPNWRLSRRLLSRGGNLYASMVLGLKVADSTSGYRVYSAYGARKDRLHERDAPTVTDSRSR